MGPVPHTGSVLFHSDMGTSLQNEKHDQLRSTSVRSAVIPSNFIFFDDASKKDVKN